MPILPVRDLAKFGVITDVDPYDLPIGAWSWGKNVRFPDGRVQRGPVFRQNGDALAETNPRHMFAVGSGTGSDTVFVAYKNGRVFQRSSGNDTDYSIAAYVNSDSEAVYTSCELGGVFYVNREDRVPWSLVPSASAFDELSGWDAGWRAKIIRAYNGSICAFNVTKGGVSYPTLVKTSDIISDVGLEPGSWDHTSTTNNATENPLAEMKSAIVDAQVLGDAMVIYGQRETWLMQADGSDEVYSYRKLPISKGAINANCSIEVNNKHYVFGTSDFWMHDGMGERSISDGRVSKYAFAEMKSSESDKFFVAHNPVLKHILFCYVSEGRDVAFLEGSGCNRAAVYDYANDKWEGFDDLPLVFSSGLANASNTTAWDDDVGSWDTDGGTWADAEGGFKRVLTFCGEESATYSLDAALYAQDLYGTGSLTPIDVTPAANPEMLLERDGIDLDEVGEYLTGYKYVLAVYPQGRLDPGGEPLEFAFGSSDEFTDQATFSAYQTYEHGNRKLDYTEGGRYLSMKVRYADYKTASLSGVDLDLISTGE